MLAESALGPKARFADRRPQAALAVLGNQASHRTLSEIWDEETASFNAHVFHTDDASSLTHRIRAANINFAIA